MCIGKEFQNLRIHLIGSLFESQMLTGNNFEENIEIRKKIGCLWPKIGLCQDLLSFSQKKS